MHVNAETVYFYFDYNARQTQTAANVARCLLKQLERNQVGLSPALEDLYENSMRTHQEPSISTFIELLKLYAQKYSAYSVFDAMDECAKEYRDDVFTFFAELQKFGYRILISTRPGESVPCQLNDVTLLQIAADRQDLEKFIIYWLEKAGNEIPALEKKCMDLANAAEGMYISRELRI